MGRVDIDPLTGVKRVFVAVHRDRHAWQEVAAVLRDERLRQHLTTSQVAQAVGEITPQYIGMVERGKRRPSLDVLVRILDALGLQPAIENDGRDVTFYTDAGRTHLTVALRSTPIFRDVAIPAWKEHQDADDARKLGEIVQALATDRDFLLSVHRRLGFDEEYNIETERAERAAEAARDDR